jgi:hypothetical protein
MKEQANTPLELYEKAYRLQYDENKVPEACRLYKVIIDEFPDSNECGYSVIQLEKLIAGAASERIVVSSRFNTILAFAAVLVSVACLICVLLVGSHFSKIVDMRLSSLTALSRNLAIQEAQRARAEDELSAKKSAPAEEKPAVDSSATAKQHPQVEPVREKAEPAAPVREVRARQKKESAPSAKQAKTRKGNPSASHQDSVSFF